MIRRDGRFRILLSTVLGFEAAGPVESVGPYLSKVKVGGRVGYLFNEGTYASERIIDVDNLIPLPIIANSVSCNQLISARPPTTA
jgi:NADPH2:quinone reductase